MKKHAATSAFAALAFACAAASAVGANIYVDRNQTTNPSDGLSWSTAWTNIADGLTHLAATNAAVQGGHTILVTNSSYLEEITLTAGHSGLDGSPNVVRALGEVLLEGKNARRGILANGCAWIDVKGFKMNTPNYGMTFNYTTNIIVEDCKVWDAQGGIAMSYATNMVFRRCTISDIDNVYGLQAARGSVLMENCILCAVRSGGINPRYGAPTELKNCILVNIGHYAVWDDTLTPMNVSISNCCFFANAAGNVMNAGTILNTADELNSLPGCSGNIVANPGFARMANEWDFSWFFDNSPCLNSGIGGVDMGAFENPDTIAVLSNTYYVAKTGDDSSATPTNPLTPWLTIGKAITIAQAGDTVMVSEGIYEQFLTITNGGSAEAPMTIRAAEGERVVVRGVGGGVMLKRVSNVVLDGLEATSVSGTTGRGIYDYYGFGNTLSRVDVYSNQQDGVIFFMSCGNRVTDSAFHHNTWSGIYVYNPGQADISRCRFYANERGLRAQGWFSADNSLFYSNTLEGIAANLSSPTPYPAQTIESCTSYGNGEEGFDLTGLYDHIDLRACIAAGNTGYGVKEGNIYSATYVTYCCFDNNIAGNFWDGNTTLRNTEEEINAATLSSNNIVASPTFKPGGFRLANGSRCIHEGPPSSPFVYDLDRTPRVVGSKAVDIGCYEWAPPAGSVFHSW